MAGLSQGVAIGIVLFVTFLWGSWFQTVKHTGSYPIVGFIAWLYVFSLGIVWGAAALLGPSMVPNGILHEISGDIPRACLVLLCGCVFAVAMQLHLTIVGRIGLILSTSVSATCCILCGTLVSAFFGGIPEGASFPLILLASVLLILATVICQVAGARRDGDAAAASPASPARGRRQDVLALVFINAVLMSFYPLATSVGLRSPLRPGGFSSLTCMAILALGAFLGSAAFTCIYLTKTRGWNAFLHPEKPTLRVILFLALIAAFCHFGGNVLHAVAAPVVSVAIATAMGNSYHVWSYLWGLLYGEFRGASRKTYAILLCGIALFVVGVLLLSFNVV